MHDIQQQRSLVRFLIHEKSIRWGESGDKEIMESVKKLATAHKP